MNDYEIEYFVGILEKKNRKIDDESMNIANKIRIKNIKRSFQIQIAIYIVIIIVCLFFVRSYYITMPVMILLIFFRDRVLNKIYDRIMKREYKKNLSDDFIERINNEYR